MAKYFFWTGGQLMVIIIIILTLHLLEDDCFETLFMVLSS